VVRVHSPRPSWCSSVWRERPFRMREAGGSSPPTETGHSRIWRPGGSDVMATCLPSTQVSAGSSPACRSMRVRRAGVLEGSSSGRTRDFGSRDRGSSPCPSTEGSRPVGPEPDIPSMSSPVLTIATALPPHGAAIMQRAIRESSSGKTVDSGSTNRGSSPCSRSMGKPVTRQEPCGFESYFPSHHLYGWDRGTCAPQPRRPVERALL
jgi:hypothetical protein